MADNGKRNIESLPADRKAAVEAGLAHYQIIAMEKDRLMGEVAALKSEMAALRVVAEAQAAQLNEMESRVRTMQAVRDQAVSDRAKYETLFVSFQSVLRAFQIPGAPLIKEMADEEASTDHDSDGSSG